MSKSTHGIGSFPRGVVAPPERHARVTIPGLGPADYTQSEIDAVRGLVRAGADQPRRLYPGRTTPMTEAEHVAALLHEAKVYCDAELLVDEWELA